MEYKLSMAQSYIDPATLTVEERLRLIEDLWLSIEKDAEMGDSAAIEALGFDDKIDPELLAEMAPLQSLAERHGLAIVEDAAQSIGSWYHGRISGTFGDIGCFSLHPLKNLNAAGDAGFLIARDAEVARRVRLWRSHGLVDRNTVTEFGTVSRLDGLQAEILRFRLTRLPSVLERRRHNAARYRELLACLPVFIPAERPDTVDTYHTFVIQLDRRDELRDFLASRGVMTAIHYPVPLHLQPAAAGLGKGLGSFPQTERQAGRIVTLPVNQFLGDDDLVYVVEQMAEFYR